VRTANLFFAALVISLALPVARAQTAELKPYTARYNVKYRGLSGGDLEFTLKSDGNGRYTFTSHVLPNFLGGMFISDQAEDSSVMQMDGSILKPLKFRSDDGGKDTMKDISYDFDWSKSSVNGRYKNQDFQLTVPAGVQDRLSIQLAASLALQAGTEPGHLVMIEKDELQDYSITRVGNEHVRVAAGEYDVVVLKSERDGSSRTTRYWNAAKLNYIPVRAERSTKGTVDIVMELKSYKAL
jgi:hypothetical protein